MGYERVRVGRSNCMERHLTEPSRGCPPLGSGHMPSHAIQPLNPAGEGFHEQGQAFHRVDSLEREIR